MDEADNKQNETPVTPPPVQPETRRDAAQLAQGVAEDIRSDAEKTLSQIKGHGFRDFFNFDKLIFPSIARIVFVVFTVAMILIGLLGILAGFSSMSDVGFFGGLMSVCTAVITAVFMIVMARLWIEIVLVAFKINDGVQDIRKAVLDKQDAK